jgi:hypothetical protein
MNSVKKKDEHVAQKQKHDGRSGNQREKRWGKNPFKMALTCARLHWNCIHMKQHLDTVEKYTKKRGNLKRKV